MLIEFRAFIKKVNMPLLFFCLLHIVFVVIGYSVTNSAPGELVEIENEVSTYFTNNFAYGLKLAAGFVSLGLLTVFLLSLNAYVLGVVIKEQILLGNDLFYIFYNLLHGFLELPALYCFYRIGITPLSIILSQLLIKEYKFIFTQETILIIKYFVIGTLLLFIAAIIEYIL